MGIKFRDRLAVIRNARYARFPTLTRLMLDPPRLPVTREKCACPLSDAFLHRLSRAFGLSYEVRTEDGVWGKLMPQSQTFERTLLEGDPDRLRPLIDDLFGGSILMGMAHTALFISPQSPYGADYFHIRCRDALLALGEALAVRPLMSNQQTSWRTYRAGLKGELGDLAVRIEHALGHSLEPPTFGGPPVALAGAFRLNPDSIRHAYVMHRIEQLGIAKDSGILEIGGGFGNVARYAWLRGFRNYTIIDLPFANAVQAAFLAGTLGEDMVALHGEDRNAAIRLVPSTRKNEMKGQFGLALNMDSLPEIPHSEAVEYAQIIGTRAQLFLSINQEASARGQHDIASIFTGQRGFHRRHRHPYWMEQGYAEELYATACVATVAAD
ncbi:MAG: hypothetical protein CVT73_06865 [Alphaproteobacteria bacterium HGW-Alphaproteobacteria-12]|nr:MAG: hypothetical protein CVT73_06865 [Alphaproteobacteria bacterium HGW-Alphaproteobacteria-12]